MRLSALLPALTEHSVFGEQDVDVKGITSDSRKVGSATDIFVAVAGSTTDGNRYVMDAIKKGAVVVITEDKNVMPDGATTVHVDNARGALAHLAAAFAGHPSRFMTMIGITGTNGKTTTSYLLHAILKAAGRAPAVTGTLGRSFGGLTLTPADGPTLTSPDPIAYQQDLSQLYVAGASHVISEVSSHALDQRRADGTHFDIGVFTNLSQDHLDYHGNFHAYFAAKRRLFDTLLYDSSKKDVTAVVNLDDSRGKELERGLRSPVTVLTFSRNAHSETDVRPVSVEFGTAGVRGVIATPQGEIEFRSPLVGPYNLSNILAAVACASRLGVDGAAISQALEDHTGAPGRLERVTNSAGMIVLVDYAHTPDALQNACGAASKIASTTGGRLTVVFGCGGDRDDAKRPKMGEIAAAIANFIYVTSDNPRSEQPEQIIADILVGIKDKTDVFVEVDRAKAIHDAIGNAKRKDVILIAGKGHETYQVIGDQTRHFDDREVAAEALSRR